MIDTPATDEDMKVGARLKCIHRAWAVKGKTCTLTHVDSSPSAPYLVTWDDGDPHNTRWSNPGSFTLIDQAATPEQMVVGTRVQCIYPGTQRTGKTGTVSSLEGGKYRIEWDDGVSTADPFGWALASSFIILPGETKVSESKQKNPPADIPEPTFDFNKYNGRLSKIKG
jgi:hypothetical protein